MREQLLKRLEAEARRSTSRVIDIAVMDQDGISAVRPVFSGYASACYSLTKSFIAAGILILFDRQQLSPDDLICPILRDYLPEAYDRGWEQVRVRDCLTHRMGIERNFLDMDEEDPRSFGGDWLKYAFSRIRIVHAPGEAYLYSDGAFYILSRIIEAVSGAEASEFLTANVTAPLEFRECAWTKCPQNHAVGGSGLFAAAEDTVKLPWLWVSGGVYRGRQIITPETIRLARENGFGLAREAGRQIYCKGGLHGQKVAANCERGLAVSWHSFDEDGISDRLLNLVTDF